jgi:hypothetical protein
MTPGRRKLIAGAIIVGGTIYFGRLWWIRGVTSGRPVMQAMSMLAVWAAWTGGGFFSGNLKILRRCSRVGFALVLPTTIYGILDMTRSEDFFANFGLLMLAGLVTWVDLRTRDREPKGLP